MPRALANASSERRADERHRGYASSFLREPCYFVGLDETPSFRERIHDIYGDNVEIISSLAEIDDYFSDRDFGERPEVGRFTGRVARSIEDTRMAEEVCGEVCNQAYVTAIKRLGYQDAPLNVAFSRNLAEERGTCFADAFVFGPGGAARIALADWLIEERLHGMYRPGKAPGPAFSKQATKIWHEAKYQNRQWPRACGTDGEFGLLDASTDKGRLPDGVEQVLRNSWRRSRYQGPEHAYKGMRRLGGEQSFQMIEDMVGALLDASSRPKLYRSPLDREQQHQYDEIIESANTQGIDPFYATYMDMFDDPDALRPVWGKARRVLYEYSSVLREAAIRAGLAKPSTTGITWRSKHQAWQAQIPVKGKQKYLGLFRNKADAIEAFDEAAARTGHIPGMPDIDRIWPTWDQEKARLELMAGRPQLPIVYQQQDTHEERKYGLRPPEALRGFVDRMKRTDWLARHCLLMFDDNSPDATRAMAIQSNGETWTREKKSAGKRFVVRGRTSIHKDTGRIGITIYRPGFDEPGVLAEEIYHVVFGVMRETSPATYKAAERWYQRSLNSGADPTISLDEAFSKAMGLEEVGKASGLPPGVVKHARSLFCQAGSRK
jgi:hypothetical protein